MALVAPFNLADAMITNVLSNVRRGVSLSRMQNTTDSTIGVMVDLPDKIDFEINLLKTHQFLARSVTTIDANNSSEGERVNASEFSINIGGDGMNTLSNEGSVNNEITSETSGDRSDGTSGDRGGSGSGENSTEGGVGTSSEKNDEKTGSTKNSKRTEKTKEDGKGSQQENSTETKTVNGTTTETDCSDRDMNTRTDRSYWKVDKETGSVVQAS